MKFNVNLVEQELSKGGFDVIASQVIFSSQDHPSCSFLRHILWYRTLFCVSSNLYLSDAHSRRSRNTDGFIQWTLSRERERELRETYKLQAHHTQVTNILNSRSGVLRSTMNRYSLIIFWSSKKHHSFNIPSTASIFRLPTHCHNRISVPLLNPR